MYSHAICSAHFHQNIHHDHWHRFPHQDAQSGQPICQAPSTSPPLLRSIDLGHCRSGTFSYPHLLLLPRLPGHHDRVRDQRPLLLQQHHQLDRANQACMHKVLMSTNSMPTRMSPSCWWETRVTWRPIGYVVDALYEEQVVSYEEGELLAKQYNIPFLETSAENGKNIDLVRPRPPMASLGL